MSFTLDFSAKKSSVKPVNDNRHNPELWGFAYALAENSTPINQWPTQYTVHYIYEFLNRPWLSEKQCIRDMNNWFSSYTPDLQLQI